MTWSLLNLFDGCIMVPYWKYFGSVMPTITVKDVPPELYETLRRLAKRNRRSLNGEVLFRLENSVQSAESLKDEALENIRKRREALAARGVWLTDEFLNKAKNEGRP